MLSSSISILRKLLVPYFFCIFLVAQANAGTTKQVTFSVDEGTNYSLTLSPDGKQLAIDLQGHIWVLPAAGGAAKRLTEVNGEARYPSWSPVGEHIAFQRYLKGQWHIWVIKPDGSGLRQVTFGAYDDREPTWSKDGKTVLFGSDRSGNYGIWQVDFSSGVISKRIDSAEEDYFPVLSPNGKQLAFVARHGKKDVLMQENGDGRAKPITDSMQTIAFPAWSPDGNQLAYISYDKYAAESGLYKVDLATNKIERLSEKNEDVFIGRPIWKSNRELLYSADGRIKRRVLNGRIKEIPFTAEFLVKTSGGYQRKADSLTSQEPRPALGVLAPAASPSGEYVAFAALGDLWLLTVGNPKPTKLTDDPYMDTEPAWSPDSTKLAYVSDRRGKSTLELYLRDMRTGKETRLTETEENVSMPVFSPDGNKIAFYLTDAGDWHAKYLHVLDLASGGLKQVHGYINKPSVPSWSADSKQLTVVIGASSSQRYRKGWNKILFIPVDGGKTRIDTPTPTKSLGIRAKNGAIWSPDGKKIAFIQDGVLWTVAVNNGGYFQEKPTRLTNILADHARWTADSKSIFFQSADQLKRLYLDDGRLETIPLELFWTPKSGKGRKVVQAGRLFDSTGDHYRNDVDIVIDNNVITDIVPRRKQWNENIQVIDARDKTVMPGLVESHIHNFSINGELTGRIAMAYGVTSAREPGADPHEGVESRESWASGRRIGPRLFTTGLLEGGRVWYGMSLPIDSPAYLELELDRAKRLQYDFIKTYERMDDAYLKRVVDFAHDMGIPVASHDLYPAAYFGADVVEHLGTNDRSAFSDRLSPAGNAYQDVVKLHQHSGMQIVPTDIGASPAAGAYFLDKRNKSLKDVEQYELVPERFFRGAWLKSAVEKDFSRAQMPIYKATGKVIAQLANAGVSVPVGTDTSFFNAGFGMLTEMQHYVEAGLSRAQALRSATVEPAKLSGVEHLLGTIEKNKLADLIVIDGDPLNDIYDLLNVETVIKDGNVYSVDALLSGAE